MYESYFSPIKEKQINVHALLLDQSVCKPCVNDTGAEVAEQQLLQQLPFCLTTAGHKTNCSWREDNIRTYVRPLSFIIYRHFRAVAAVRRRRRQKESDFRGVSKTTVAYASSCYQSMLCTQSGNGAVIAIRPTTTW